MLVVQGSPLINLHSLRTGILPAATTVLRQKAAFAAKAVESQQDDTPSLTASSSVMPRKQLYFAGRGLCPVCHGQGREPCTPCEGKGWLGRGAFNRRNPVPTQPINAKFTSLERVLGWRHFKVIQQRKVEKLQFLLMQASCDPAARLWVSRETVRDRSIWAAGWLQLSDILAEVQSNGADTGTMPATAKPCPACSATGMTLCKYCDAAGVDIISL
mmetsp:Transcript_6866/g.11693  ORF Transcript_6866/g.11693 Transcript_6866/m.11693 type:complete len:215 (-) Transcript_6866:472-1116(-)